MNGYKIVAGFVGVLESSGNVWKVGKKTWKVLEKGGFQNCY